MLDWNLASPFGLLTELDAHPDVGGLPVSALKEVNWEGRPTFHGIKRDPTLRDAVADRMRSWSYVYDFTLDRDLIQRLAWLLPCRPLPKTPAEVARWLTKHGMGALLDLTAQRVGEAARVTVPSEFTVGAILRSGARGDKAVDRLVDACFELAAQRRVVLDEYAGLDQEIAEAPPAVRRLLTPDPRTAPILLAVACNLTLHLPPDRWDRATFVDGFNHLFARLEVSHDAHGPRIDITEAHPCAHDVIRLALGGLALTHPQAKAWVQGEGWRTFLESATAEIDPLDGRELGWRVDTQDAQLKIEAVAVDVDARGTLAVRKASKDAARRATRDPKETLILDLLPRLGEPGARKAVLQLLVGHPRVVAREGRGHVRLDVRQADLRLAVEHAHGAVQLHVYADGQPVPAERAAHGWCAIDLPARVMRVIAVGEREAQAWSAVARLSSLPAAAMPALVPRLADLQRATGAGLQGDIPADEVPADRRLHALLDEPTGDASGLMIRLRVHPIPGGPWLIPGEGDARLLHATGAQVVAAQRDLAGERAGADALWSTLHLTPGDPLVLTDLPAALSAVERLGRMDVVVHWRGRPLRLRAAVHARDLRLTVESAARWFKVKGEVNLGDRLASLQALLESEIDGFVRVGDREFARLDPALRSAFDQLRALPQHGDVLQAHAAHAAALDAVKEAGVDLKADAAFERMLQRLHAASDLHPAVPAGLVGVLRPYQVQGFTWMARVTSWAGGAVLADDMGLGKTLQTLALLAWAAHEGPALVVAPTSVGPNWAREAGRFTPDLRVRVLRAGAREIGEVGAGDVVVTSYDLAWRDEDALAAVPWATVVIDEAHAVKNAATRRGKAMQRLEAKRVIALTGTPVENHVGELWGLLRVVVPGLLGSWEQFRETFGAAVDRGDADARRSLSVLLRPFVLRRVKAQVAPELPARTELIVPVEMSAAERALYDTVRLKALAHLEGMTGAQQRIAVLAELTRLRQLACDPRLLDRDSPVTGSKLPAVLDLLSQLRENGHRTLMFSQFTGHLGLVAEALDRAGVRYRYLDGGTPSARRQAEIEAFQAGDSDVFLISLKAGGVGLNLTAADTVVHLDPWWNPAAEDQATDRAHRIGQDKPVTVYRMVTRGSIEETVIDLHDTKRGLVASLLSGTDAAARWSQEELLGLLRGAPATEEPAAALDAAPAAEATPPSAPTGDHAAHAAPPGAAAAANEVDRAGPSRRTRAARPAAPGKTAAPIEAAPRSAADGVAATPIAAPEVDAAPAATEASTAPPRSGQPSPRGSTPARGSAASRSAGAAAARAAPTRRGAAARREAAADIDGSATTPSPAPPAPPRAPGSEATTAAPAAPPVAAAPPAAAPPGAEAAPPAPASAATPSPPTGARPPGPANIRVPAPLVAFASHLRDEVAAQRLAAGSAATYESAVRGLLGAATSADPADLQAALTARERAAGRAYPVIRAALRRFTQWTAAQAK